ncbi:MAG TPA: hypothetical protein VG106_14790 [Vicinamibacterales bacterium]|nr:hypothetical protein [Vicinamibacterales bacterium]
MEISEIRRRLRGAIEGARAQAAARRARADTASRDFDAFLAERATPIVRTFADALVAEGHLFKVFTPAGSIRLASQPSPDDFIELFLDTDADPPQAAARVSRGRGRRNLSHERPVRRGTAVADLNEEDVLALLLEEIVPFVER